jgi:hypothetical protein
VFIGHFAVGFAAKSRARATPVTVLVLATIFLDVLWPLFLTLGVERAAIAPVNRPFLGFDFVSYPWSHSLAMAIVWSFAFGAVYRAITRDGTGARWAGVLVFSHWVLDFVTHQPDMPIAPGLPWKIGLGLWNHAATVVVIESLMFIGGIALYLRATRARSAWGHVSLWSLVALLVAVYYADLTGPAPPSMAAVITVAMVANVATVLWLLWIDRTHRPA